MKITKARASSGDTLVLIFLALASFPVAAIAFDQPTPYYRRGAEYPVYSEPIRLSLSTHIVEQVQLALRQRGYYRGEIDGFSNVTIEARLFAAERIFLHAVSADGDSQDAGPTAFGFPD